MTLEPPRFEPESYVSDSVFVAAVKTAAREALAMQDERAENRAEIAELRGELERYRDRAVCSGCGQDVNEGGACETDGCFAGAMIPASELPQAFLAAIRFAGEQLDEAREEARHYMELQE